MASNTITIDFDPCEPSPMFGYKIRYRPHGSMISYRSAPSHFFTSPAVFLDNHDADGTSYEGIIQGDCGGNMFGAEVHWVAINGAGPSMSASISQSASESASIPVPGFDVDAQAFIDAVGTLDETAQNAINDLVVSLKGAGLWTKFYALYPYAGSTAAEHKWNLKDPRDLNAAYRLIFTNMGHSSNGLVPSSSSADTFFSTFPNINSEHIAAYILTNNTTVGCELGNTDSSANNGTGFYARATGNNTYYNTDAAAKILNPTLDSRGFWVVSRTGASALEINRNGSTEATSSSSAAAGPGITIKIATDAGGVNNTDKITAWNSIGLGLSTAEIGALYTIVQAYQTALGRSV